MTDTTPTDLTADERERLSEDLHRLERQNTSFVHRLDWHRENAGALMQDGWGDVSVWRKRAEQAEGGRKRLMKRIRAAEAERDALRARIKAARQRIGAYILQGTQDGQNVDSEIMAADAALAGDQPAPEPYQCSQEPHLSREFYGEGACAECGFKPEPPYLDPEPHVDGHGRRFAEAYSDSGHCSQCGTRFKPRPADENGKPYSPNREDYGQVQS